MIEYGTFKTLQILLFWGSAIGFCVWQLRSTQRMRQQRAKIEQDDRPARRPRNSDERRLD